MEVLDNGNILTCGVFLPGSWDIHGVFLPGSWDIFNPGYNGVFLPGSWDIHGVFLPGSWDIKSFVAECDDDLNSIEVVEIDMEGLVINEIIKPRRGSIVAVGSLNDDICLIKLDNNYNIISYKTYTFTGYDGGFGKSIIQTEDDGYAIACGVFLPGSWDICKPAVIKTDSDGNMDWSNVDFLPEGNGYATGLIDKEGEEIVVCGVAVEGTSNPSFKGMLFLLELYQ